MSRKTLWWIHIVLTLGLWLVLMHTALNVKISYDESLSFYILKTNDWRKLIGMANTHWLNSLWMKIAMLTSGDNLFAMRMLSLAAFPLYATGIFCITQTFKNQKLALIAYALILLNPYALQFFALARGYGLVMAIQVWIVYHLILILNQKNNTPDDWYTICHLCLLMMLANFSYLYTLFGVFAIFLLHVILRKKGYERNKATLKITLYFILIIAGTAANLMIYKYAGDLWFGGKYFVESIFGSVWVRYTYYLSAEILPQVLSYLTLGIIALTITYFTIDFFRKKEINAGVGLSIIVLTILGLNIFFKLTFGSLYIFKRTALMWWIPVIVLFFIWLETITNKSSGSSKISALPLVRTTFFSVVIGALLLANFIFQYKNHYYTRIEKRQYDELIYNDLVKLNPTKVGMGEHFTMQLQNYYQFKNEQLATLNYGLIYETKLAACQNETAWRDLAQFDYIISSESETIDCLHQKNIPFELMKTYGKHQLIRLR